MVARTTPKTSLYGTAETPYRSKGFSQPVQEGRTLLHSLFYPPLTEHSFTGRSDEKQCLIHKRDDFLKKKE